MQGGGKRYAHYLSVEGSPTGPSYNPRYKWLVNVAPLITDSQDAFTAQSLYQYLIRTWPGTNSQTPQRVESAAASGVFFDGETRYDIVGVGAGFHTNSIAVVYYDDSRGYMFRVPVEEEEYTLYDKVIEL